MTIFVVTISCFACKEAVDVESFAELHRTIYHSMSIEKPSKLYDSLATVFTDSQIEMHYKKFRSFQKKNKAENIQVVIDNIEYLDTRAKGDEIEVHWVVRGRILHNNHIHYRSLSYKAKYKLVKSGQGWKIASSEITEYQDFQLTEAEQELGQKNVSM